MTAVEMTDIEIRVLGPPTYDRYDNHEVPIEDEGGRIADLRVWSKHQGQPEWRVGSRYRLERLKQNPLEANKARYETASGTRISRIGNPNSPNVSLLHVSDTHLGRHLTDKERVGAGDQVERFLDAIAFALRYRVDGILHTGDFFDDDVSEEIVASVEEHLGLLAEAGIPIYYVHGNHRCDRGDAFLEAQTRRGQMIHLSNEPEILGGGEVALYGMDVGMESDELPQNAPSGNPPSEAHRILSWHDAVEPLARNGVSVEQVVDASRVRLDSIALGDLHKSKRAYINTVRDECGQNLRMFYAGATTRIARNASGYEPSVWLLQITGGTLERHQIPLYS